MQGIIQGINLGLIRGIPGDWTLAHMRPGFAGSILSASNPYRPAYSALKARA